MRMMIYLRVRRPVFLPIARILVYGEHIAGLLSDGSNCVQNVVPQLCRTCLVPT